MKTGQKVPQNGDIEDISPEKVSDIKSTPIQSISFDPVSTTHFPYYWSKESELKADFDVNIDEFLFDSPQIVGIIKSSCDDFCVREIAPNGNICSLPDDINPLESIDGGISSPYIPSRDMLSPNAIKQLDLADKLLEKNAGISKEEEEEDKGEDSSENPWIVDTDSLEEIKTILSSEDLDLAIKLAKLGYKLENALEITEDDTMGLNLNRKSLKVKGSLIISCENDKYVRTQLHKGIRTCFGGRILSGTCDSYNQNSLSDAA
ncbi:Pseudouridine synthase, TruD like protein, partial [Aduncisulcus paluster]